MNKYTTLWRTNIKNRLIEGQTEEDIFRKKLKLSKLHYFDKKSKFLLIFNSMRTRNKCYCLFCFTFFLFF